MRIVLLGVAIGLTASLVANMATTVYLHSGARPPGAHVADTRDACVPVRDLGVHRHPAAPMGRRPPEAPRVHRRRGRPALPRAPRLAEGPDAQPVDVSAGGSQRAHGRAIREGPSPGPTRPLLLRPRPRRPGHRHGVAVPAV